MPSTVLLVGLLEQALRRREEFLDRAGVAGTDCVRLFHGAVEGLPGIAMDRYGPVVLAQVWRPEAVGHLAPLDELADVLRSHGIDAPLRVHLRGAAHRSVAPVLEEPSAPSEGREEGLRYDVTPPASGRDPLLYLDFRAGRRAVRTAASGKQVLNLFAYTCGVGVAAAAGGAAGVLNVDFAQGALDVGRANAALNGLEDRFEVLKEDVIPVMRQFSGLGMRGRASRREYVRLEAREFDLVVLDPPRWAKSPFGAVDLVRDYASLLKPAVRSTTAGGELLVTNNVASVDEEDWLSIVRRCAAKAGRPVRELQVIRPDEDFPSPDGRPPLKMAWLRL